MTPETEKRLEIEIKKSYYSAQRYQELSTFAMLYHPSNLPVDTIGNMVRLSDQIIKIDAHHYFIVFNYTTHEQAFRAAENLLLELDNYFNNRESCIGLDSFNPKQSPTIVIHRLTQILEEVRKNEFLRVEDENILNEIV